MSRAHSSTRPHVTREPRRRWPGLASTRVFSREDINPIEATSWEKRDLASELRAVQTPTEWSTERAVEFLRMRAEGREISAEMRTPPSVRVEIERLLVELRGAALREGYFARLEDASIFADELGALLLSGRARLSPASFLLRQPETAAQATWRWDAARGTFAQQPAELHAAGNWTCVRRVMTLDDADLAAFLAGRDDSPSDAAGSLLVLNDDLLHAAQRDVRSPVLEHGVRSGASELLECIAHMVLNRGDVDLLYAGTMQRSDPLRSDEEAGSSFEVALPGVASLALERFLSLDGRMRLGDLRHAAALLVTALEIGIDGQVFPEEKLAIGSHNERRLAIGLSGVGRVLAAAGLDVHSDEARSIARCLTALLSAEGLWQSARIAETCPPIRPARSQAHPQDAEEMAHREMKREDGACPAFHEQPERVLEWMCSQRAQAYQLLGAKSEAVSSSVAISGDTSGADNATAEESPLVQQLPEMIAWARHAWDGALRHAERFGLRHIGVSGFAHGGSGWFGAPAKETKTLANSDKSDEVDWQIRMFAECQSFVTACLPCEIDVKVQLSAQEVTHMVLEGWKSGMAGISLLQPESAREGELPTLRTEQGAANQERGRPPMEEQSAPQLASVPERDRQPNDADQASVALTRTSPGASPASAEQEQPRTRQAETALQGMTLAEAERAAMDRGHTTLVETQLQRISELEEQVKLIQAKARENGEMFDAKEPPRAMRHRLPAERASITHKFLIAGHEGYITVGLYPNGSPGEIFLRMTKEGSAVAGLLDSFATAVSLALQHGVPVRALAERFAETRFEPSGATANEQIPYALSIMDYLFRWIELRFLSGHQMDLFANLSPASPSTGQVAAVRVTGTVSGPKSNVVPNVFGKRLGES